MNSNPPLKLVKRLRKSHGFTSRQMSELLGISKSMYSYIENGQKRLTYDIAVKICGIFDTTPDELIYPEYVEFFKTPLI